MRHRHHGKKLGRSSSHRKALRMNLATQLFTHGRIRTDPGKSQVRAGALRAVDNAGQARFGAGGGARRRLIAVHARRQVARRLNNDRVLVGKVFDELAPLYADRPGGYTRILKLGPRKGDNAEMALIELVDYEDED